jgi:hypothetical protein
MLTVDSRPMTWEERIEVQQTCLRAYPPLLSRDGLSQSFFGVACGGFCSAILITIPAALLYVVLSLLHLPTAILGWLIAGGAVAGALFSGGQMRKEQAEWAGTYAQELADGVVELLHCTVQDAAEVADPDGDPGYFLDVGDSRLLYLFAQCVESSAEDGCFPNSELRWVRTPRTRTTLAFECLGEPFPLSRQIEPDYETSESLPRHGDVFPGTLDTLKEDLRRFQASRSEGE